ncbi:MAG TPA: amidohydrolase family protein [Acidimicrobiales bacterium]
MYNGTKVLDVHGHVSVPQASNVYATMLLASNSITRSPIISGRGGLSEEEFRAAAARHVAYMDERNIDVQIIGPRPFLMLGQVFSKFQMELWTEHVNASIAQQVTFHPDRFLGAAQLPQDQDAPDATHMLATLESAVKDHGFVAAYVGPDPKGLRETPGLNEPYWFPLWEKAIELGVNIIVHGTNTQDPRHYLVPQNYQLGFVMEQFLAQQLLSNSDVFERYPALKVVVCHCGGALNRFIKSDSHLSQKDLSENLFYDTCAHDLDFLTAAIRQRGVGSMVFGTEAPGSGAALRQAGEGPGKSGDDIIPVLDSFDWLSAEDKVAIINTNPLKVFPQFAKV